MQLGGAAWASSPCDEGASSRRAPWVHWLGVRLRAAAGQWLLLHAVVFLLVTSQHRQQPCSVRRHRPPSSYTLMHVAGQDRWGTNKIVAMEMVQVSEVSRQNQLLEYVWGHFIICIPVSALWMFRPPFGINQLLYVMKHRWAPVHS